MRGCPSKVDLSAFIDNELRPKETEAVAEHLRSCRTCAAYVEDWRRQTLALRALPAASVRHSLAAQVRRRIAWQGAGPQAGPYAWRPYGFRARSWLSPRAGIIPAALVVLVAFGVAAFRTGDSAQAPESSADPYLQAYMEDYDAYQALMSSSGSQTVGLSSPDAEPVAETRDALGSR